MGSCIHSKIEDIYEIIDDGFIRMKEFKGYKHYCDKDQEAYEAWHKRNENNTYDQYKNDEMPCYEPTELTKSLDNMIDLAQKIVDQLEKQKENENN
jgi:hypothetical protein